MGSLAKNTTITAMCLSLTGMVSAYEVKIDSQKSIVWKYHDCVMDLRDYKTGSLGDDGTGFFTTAQDGRIPTSGTAAACYAVDFNTTKKRLTAPATLNTLDSKISFTLQERRHIDRSNVVLSSDDQTNIYVAPGKNVEVWATFMNEGAGFENSVGFFTWSGKDPQEGPAGNKPVRRASDGVPVLANGGVLSTERIFLPRSSTTFPIPRSTTTGTTVYLGKFNGGTNGLGIGFMVVANGWKGDARGAGKGGVSPTRDKSWIYYSVKKMNPECIGKTEVQCNNLDQHTILLNDQEVTGSDGAKYRRMVLGIEDFKRTESSCDHDFNDVLMAVHIKPDEGAVTNLDSLPKIGASTDPDTDGDGVKDSLDEFPNDSTRAYSRYYPGKSSWGTLAYEDLWPERGDYDFNDLLLRYRSREVLNANRLVVALEMDLRLDAVGAGYRNGFAINLPGISNSTIQSATLTGTRRDRFSGNAIAISTSPPHQASVTGGQGGSVFQIFEDAKVFIHPDNGASGGANSLYNTVTCSEPGFRNTGKDCAVAPSADFKLSVKFNTPLSAFPSAPYDPFLFRAKTNALSVTGTAVEVHLPGKLPTTRADRTMFGTGIDRTPVTTSPSTVVPGDTYLSNGRLPWALDIPSEWDYSYEKQDITQPFPNVVPWVLSGGKTNTDWYSTPSDPTKTFKANAKIVNN